MRRGVLTGAVVLALLAAAAVLALLADSVLAVGDDLETRADRLAQPGPPPEAPSESGLRLRVARSLVGAEGDLELLSALERFDRSRQAALTSEEQLEAHGELEADLTRLAREGDDLEQRSRAANLNGVLLVEDARLDRSSASRFLQLGLESFRQAVTLDPANDEAKANLELLVGLLTAGEGSIGQDSGNEGAAGAGASPGTTGY